MTSWYPSHIARATADARAHSKRVDIIIEIVDARAPQGSRYGKRAFFENKKRLLVMTRCDLADRSVTPSWARYFKSTEQISVIQFTLQKTRRHQLVSELQRLGGNRPRTCMVLGLPNVGKSTVLNVLSGRSKARTGSRPGVTRGVQWIEAAEKIRVLDFPGLVLPQNPSPDQLLLLSALGIIPESVAGEEETAVWLIKHIIQNGSNVLLDRYKADGTDPAQLLEQIAASMGAVQSGGRPDYLRAARIVCSDFGSGRLGRWTLELPPGDDDG